MIIKWSLSGLFHHIKWTFRDDGVLLFFENNITCSNDSLRSAWKISNGVHMRNGIWEKTGIGK